MRRRNLPSTILAAALAGAIVAGVALVTAQSAIPFDAAYNLLPYKNLVEGGGFGHRYGSATTPFQPAVSTGPTVNLPIAAAYAAWRRPETLFVATAVVVGAYWALLLWAFLRLERDRPVLALALLAPLLVLNAAAFEQRLLTAAFGELPAVALVCAGIAVGSRGGAGARNVGALLIGLAIATKAAIGVALLLPAALVAVGAVKRGRAGGALWPRLATPAALLLAPVLLWRVVLPRLALSATDWRRFSDAARARSAFEGKLAFGGILDPVRALLRGDAPADDVLDGVASRVDALAAFHGDPAAAYAFVVAALVATAWCLRREPREDRAAGWIGLFGLGNLLWWLLANRLGWYRHLFPTDLAFAIVIVHAVLGMTTPGGRSPAAARAAGLALYLAGFVALAGTGLARLPSQRATLAASAQEKRAVLSLAGLVRGRLLGDAAFYTVEWYQAPEVQLLTANVFRDVRVARDVASDLAAGRTPYLVVTPDTLGYEHSHASEIPALRATAPRTLFDDAGYQLLELDPATLRSVVEVRHAVVAEE